MPEPALIKVLMKIIFMENKHSVLATREITPLADVIDQIPVVRSSLLQLLLDHK